MSVSPLKPRKGCIDYRQAVEHCPKGTSEHRQAVEHCPKGTSEHRQAVERSGTPDNDATNKLNPERVAVSLPKYSVTPSGLWLVCPSVLQGFRASHSTACL